MVALSELHSRLEHLVSYSSQLIFVSGETIGQQQSLLEAFLGQQSELCEIAYLTASSKLTITDYRRQFVRQLLGETEGILSRPLNELLAPLNQHEGPVIICICQAENMPRQLLQEMWELVLQSRFAGNKQHLNVLLFGQPEWAEQAKAWIPANNRDKPLILSNESVSSEFVLQDNTSVQALIAHKRQLFEQRLKTRHQSAPASQSLLQRWWIKLLLLCAFLFTFCGMLVWEYSAESLAYWHKLNNYIFAQAAPASDELDTTSPVEQDEPLVLKEIEVIPPATAVDASPITEDPALPPQAKEDALVTDWQSAIDRIEQKQDLAADLPPQPAAAVAEPAAAVAEPAAAVAGPVSSEVAAAPIDSAAEGLVITAAAPRIIDYPVEDIVSEAQLEPAASSIVAPVVESFYPYDESALLALDDNHYVVQLSAMSSKSVLQEFIVDQQLSDSSWIYLTQRFGGDWYVVLHKQGFPSRELARQASLRLPASLLASEPFVKKLATVKQEIDSQ
jgi:DamX protein